MLKIGSVIHSFSHDTIPPKNKFGVCVNPYDQLFLLINTENRTIYECVEIKASKYPFLKGSNRFISCSRIFKFDLSGERFKLIYEIDAEDMSKIYDKIKTSSRLSAMDKARLLIPEVEKLGILETKEIELA